MAHDTLGNPTGEESWPRINPWRPLLGGLAAVGLGLAVAQLAGDGWVLPRVLLIVGGLIAAGWAVSLRLQAGLGELDERVRSAAMLAVAALVALVAYAGMEGWDSLQLLLGAMVAVTLGGAFLVLLPQTPRRVVFSLLVLFHFGGILTAVFSVPPPNAPGSWITSQLWTRVYRPYLQFMYLNNAYHFYSPEPGPPCLLWFRIEYADGSSRWIKIPNRDDFPTRLAYQRRLALTESTNLLGGTPLDFEQRWARRQLAGNMHNPPIPPYPIQMMMPAMQYREPVPYAKLMLKSYARHVARHYPSETNPDLEVKGIKIYRVVHSILMPHQFAQGADPLDETTYIPFYQGEYDKDGNLKDPNDPFLYWLIPILKVPREDNIMPFHLPIQRRARPDAAEYELMDCLKIHAGDLR